MDDEAYEARIEASWRTNSAAWIRAVRGKAIASRVRVTDQAVLRAALEHAPRTAIDIGCGEGWLTRELTRSGVAATGVDRSQELIAAARRGGGNFLRCDYRDLAETSTTAPAEVVVCNFSLLGARSTRDVFRALPRLVTPRGRIVIQTLHPCSVADAADRNGWREGSWAGCGEGFADAAPWYFRTLDSWKKLFEEHSLALLSIREPRDPASGARVSILFIAAWEN